MGNSRPDAYNQEAAFIELWRWLTNNGASSPSDNPPNTDTTFIGDVDVVKQNTFTDRSGTITTGGTSQQVAAANTTRRYFILQNVSTSDLWVNFGVAAVTNQPSLKLPPDSSIVFEGTFVTTQTINIIGATTGQAFSAKEGSE